MLTGPALGKVRAVSTDGEATVYLTEDFSGDFDLTYDVHFPASPGNHSWSVISLLLLGRTPGGGFVSVGLSRGSPRQTVLSAFTDAARAQASSVYRSSPVRCTTECTIELRGTKNAIFALADHRPIGTWQRKALALRRPYVQVNGEVSAIGDRISARLFAVRTKNGHRKLPVPTCAFTTQGVRAYAMRGGLRFSGRRSPSADATYVHLPDGATGDTCRDAALKHGH
ncbi:MAG TPA: hypothetical protein VJP85_00185 [Candidatus Baltobacteraceae bacterium]|nr:hypothetical protein [Candidatus Baltobacteraceae bacterium]